MCQRLISARLVHGALAQLPHQQTESAAVTTCPILRCTGQITEGRETSDVGARSWESSLVLKQQRAISMPLSPSEQLPRWLSGKKKKKNLPADSGDAGDTDSVPGLGRSPGGGNGNPLKYCCLENPMDMDRGVWWAKRSIG